MLQSRFALLVIHSCAESHILFSGTVSESEWELLEHEAEVYNNHIALMSSGSAPPSCYTNPEDALQRYLQHHRDKYHIEGEYLAWEKFDLVVVDENGFDGQGCLVFSEERWKEIQERGELNSLSFFTDTYTEGRSYSLGHGVLPMTYQLYERSV